MSRHRRVTFSRRFLSRSERSTLARALARERAKHPRPERAHPLGRCRGRRASDRRCRGTPDAEPCARP
eukprot:6201452-Pleurochrysis_carterae.AAC.1